MSFLRHPPEVRGKARMIVEAQPGVDIEVLDASFKRLDGGVTRLDLNLPEGLYTVRFSAAGAIEERVVRLLAIAQPLVVQGGDFALEGAPPSEGPGASDYERRQARAFSSFPKPPRAGEEQEIAVFVRAPDERTRSDVSRSLRLFDTHDADVRPLEASEADQHAQEGWGTRRWVLRPGCYRLRYESNARRIAEQTICAFPGRRTYAFLQYGSSIQVEGAGEAARPVMRRGVDAALTTLVSSPMVQLRPREDDGRLADILLYAIRALSTGIDPEVVEQLAEQDACPYLQVYAAAALTRRLEAARGESGSSGPDGVASDISIPWLEDRIERLLASVVPGRWPDVQAIGWRLAMLRVPPGDPGAVLKLRAPPILDCSWRWAAAFSVANPDCLPVGGAFAAAADARVPAGPWLVWSSAAARASAVTDDETDLSELAPTLSELETELREVFARQAGVQFRFSGHGLSTEALRTMSVTSQEVAAALLGAGRRTGGVIEEAQHIASYLGTPARILAPRLTEALAEVRRLKSEL